MRSSSHSFRRLARSGRKGHMNMSDRIIPWGLGLLISLCLGHIVTKWFVRVIRRQAGCDDKRYSEYLEYYRSQVPEEQRFRVIPLSPGLQGALERLFFTVLFVFVPTGTPTAMMAWLAVKMITNLNRGDLLKLEIVRSRALTGLTGAMVSLFFAVLGGLVCGTTIRIPGI